MAIIKPRVSLADLESDHSQKYWFEQRIVVLQLVHQLALGAKATEVDDLERQLDTQSRRIEQLERSVESEMEKRREIEAWVADVFQGSGDAEINFNEPGRNPSTCSSTTKSRKFPNPSGTSRLAALQEDHLRLLKRTEELELRTQKMEYQLRFYEKELNKEVDRAASLEQENIGLKQELYKKVCEERERKMDAKRVEIYKHLENKAKKRDYRQKGDGEAFLTLMTENERIATGSNLLNTKKQPELASNKNGKSKKPGFFKRVFKYYCF